MFSTLSDTQKEIVFTKTGKVVVRACPGSGKTFSVAARVAHKIQNWKTPNIGLAAISFTNVAWEEIENKLSTHFNIRHLSYPHFLGTIDSFINNYIVLPHGHLIIPCNKRPVLVGDPHNTWTIKKYDQDYDQYFDIVSYGINDELLYPEIQGTFFFGYSKIYNNNGSESGFAKGLRDMKAKYWKLGYINQHDANYFAMRLLEKYPLLAKAIVLRFPELILDEAQDTNNVQMRIIEILCENGLSNMMLVGDPDQAIFEWNKAKPKLFKAKYEEWKDNAIILNDNRRSSQVICNATFQVSTLETPSMAVDENVKDLGLHPEVVIFSSDNIKDTVDTFLNTCKEHNIDLDEKKIAVVCRSKTFLNEIVGNAELSNSKWTEDIIFTYPLVHACYLFSNGLIKKAFKIAEVILYKKQYKQSIATKTEIERHIEKVGFLNHRSHVLAFLQLFPKASGNIDNWINNSNTILKQYKWKLSMLDDAKQFQIENLFSLIEKEIPFLGYSAGTVHSVKGETFDAILVFLKTKGIGKNYVTLLNNNISSDDDEELRIVYVAITRPKKLLMIAVPDENNQKAWKTKLAIP